MIVGVGRSAHDTHTCVILENLCHCKDKTLTDKITECWRFLTPRLTVINN